MFGKGLAAFGAGEDEIMGPTWRMAVVAAGALLISAAGCRAPEHAVPAPQPTVAVGGATPSQQRDTAGMANEPTQAKEYEGQAAAGPSTPTAPATRPEPKATKWRCTHDEECALTLVEEGGCCDKCSQRAMRFADLQALLTRCAEDRKRCPQPACAPPRLHAHPVCREGNCAVAFERND